ncbi:MAG TPA: hypothetical protein VF584_21935 [Longimicrobium sp.]|jgi:hypothetical protein
MKKLGTMLSGAAIALGLGYGATHAFASSTAQAGAYCMTAQERTECYFECQSQNLFAVCDPETGCRCEP